MVPPTKEPVLKSSLWELCVVETKVIVAGVCGTVWAIEMNAKQEVISKIDKRHEDDLLLKVVILVFFGNKY